MARHRINRSKLLQTGQGGQPSLCHYATAPLVVRKWDSTMGGLWKNAANTWKKLCFCVVQTMVFLKFFCKPTQWYVGSHLKIKDLEQIPSGKHSQFANLKMDIDIVDLAINSMLMFHINRHFPMVFPLVYQAGYIYKEIWTWIILNSSLDHTTWTISHRPWYTHGYNDQWEIFRILKWRYCTI
jgi:hypothetical protein